MAGGLISFPIIARLLTQDQYGAMTLISVSISIVAPFATLGLNHSTLRFHPEYERCKKVQSFYSTLLISSFTSGIFSTVFAIAVVKLFSISHDVSFELWRAFLLASLLIIIRVMFDIICSIYRVREQPWTYSFFFHFHKIRATRTNHPRLDDLAFGAIWIFLWIGCRRIDSSNCTFAIVC